MGWSAADIPDQSGRIIVITGATSGIGLEAARMLGRAGAHVVLAVRNVDKGAAVRDSVGALAEVRLLDVSSLESVRGFAAGWNGPIDVLVNNAGIMAVPLARTVDGFESQLGTNFLGHFALTGLLLPQVRDRVVTLSSGVHRTGRIDLDDLNFDRRRYSRWGAYGQSKLADLMFAYELQRRLHLAGSPVRSVAAHPGYASTNLQAHLGPVAQVAQSVLGRVGIVQDAVGGALPTVYAATVPDVPGGAFVGPSGLGELSGAPQIVGSSKASHDAGVQRRLWEQAVELTGVDPQLALDGDAGHTGR